MIRAHLNRTMTGFGLDVSIVQHFEGEQLPEARQIMHLRPVGTGDEQYLVTTWETLIPGEATRPTLHLGDQEAVALMTALVAWYQGVDDQRMLRKDYDAERGRVDKLLDTVTEIARGRSA